MYSGSAALCNELVIVDVLDEKQLVYLQSQGDQTGDSDSKHILTTRKGKSSNVNFDASARLWFVRERQMMRSLIKICRSATSRSHRKTEASRKIRIETQTWTRTGSGF